MKRGVLQASTLAGVAFAVAAVLDYGFVLVMSWLLPTEAYGTLGVAATWFLLLSFFVASGFPMALAKFLSESSDPQRGLLRLAVRANLLLALGVVGAFLLLTFYGPLSPGPGFGRMVWAVALAVVLLSVGSTLQFALQGRMAFASFGVLHATKSMGKLVVGTLLVLVGFGAPGAVGGLVASGALLVAASWILLRRSAPDVLARGDVPAPTRRRLFAYTWSVFAGSFALTLLMSLDLLGVKYLSPPETSNVLAAHYQAATILTKAPLWAVLAALSVVFPLLSRASRRDPAEANALLHRVLRWGALALAPFLVVLGVFPALVLGALFPDAYLGAAPILAVSALGMGALSLCLVLTRALQATDRARFAGAALVVSVFLQVALLVAWVPAGGAMGAAQATAVASVTGALLILAGSAGTFRLRLLPHDAAALAASLGLLAAIIAALRPTSRIATLGAIAAGLAGYAVAVVALGLVRRSERRAALRWLTSAAPEPEGMPVEV